MKTSNVRKLELENAGATAPRLGRGIVTATSVDEGVLALALEDGREVTAELALALPYAACEGDVLLVIGEGDAHFVIGVISGRGRTELALQGDVGLRAVGGKLQLSGDEGVVVRGPEVSVSAQKLTLIADAVVETFATLFQRITEKLHVHAREEVSIVDEAAYKQARTLAVQTEREVTIQGKEIHLG